MSPFFFWHDCCCFIGQEQLFQEKDLKKEKENGKENSDVARSAGDFVCGI